MNFTLGIFFNSSQLSSYVKNLRRDAQQAGRDLDSVTQRATRSSRSVENLGRRTVVAGGAMGRAGRQADQYSRALGRGTRQSDAFGRSQQRAGRVTTAFGKALDWGKKRLAGFAAQLVLVVATLFTVHAALHQLSDSIRVFREYELRAAGVAAVSRATAAEMAVLNAQTRELGETTIFTARQAAEAQESLARAGFTFTENLSALPRVLQLAVAGELSLASAADIAAGSLRGFHIAATDAQRPADVLATSAAIANTTVEEMGHALKFAAPTAHGLGISIEDTAAALSLLADNMLKGTLGGTGFRMSMLGIIDPTGKAEDVLTDLGITADEFRKVLAEDGLIAALRLLVSESTSIKEAITIAGARGGTALQVLISQIDRLAEKRAALNDITGAAERMAAVKLDTLSGDTYELTSAIESLKISFGKGVAPDLRKAFDELTVFFQEGKDGAEGWGRVVGRVILAATRAFLAVANAMDVVVTATKALVVGFVAFKAVGIAGHLLAAAGAFLAFNSGIALGNLHAVQATGIIARLRAGLAALNATMLANPYTVVGLALAAVAVGVYLLHKRHAEAAAAAAAYHAELRSGAVDVEGVTTAHDEMVESLQRARVELQGGRDDTEEYRQKLQQLEPLLTAMRDALQGGDEERYQRLVQLAEQLGVAVGKVGGTGFERVRGEVEALRAELEAAEVKVAQAGKEIAKSEELLAAAAAERAEADGQRRDLQLATLAELRAQVKRTEQELSDLWAGHRATDDPDILIARTRQLTRQLADLRERADSVAVRVDHLNERLGLAGQTALVSSARLRGLTAEVESLLSTMAQAGDIAGFAAAVERLPDDVFAKLFPRQTRDEVVEWQRSLQRAGEREMERLQGEATLRQRLSEEEKERLEKLAKLRKALAEDVTHLNALAGAYGAVGRASAEALDEVEVQNRLRQVGIDLSKQERAALEADFRKQVHAERVAAGQKLIDDLEAQVEAQQRLAEAVATGEAALASSSAQNELAGRVYEGTTTAAAEQRAQVEQLVRTLYGLEQQVERTTARGPIDEETAALREQVAVRRSGAAAVAAVAAAQRVENEVRAATVGRAREERVAIAAATRERERARAILQATSTVADLEEEVRQLRERAAVRREDFVTERAYQQAVADVNAQQEVRNRLLELEAERLTAVFTLKRGAFETEQEYADALADVNRRFQDLKASASAFVQVRADIERQDERVLAALRTAQQAWGNFIEGVQRDLASAYEQAFDEGLNSAEDFAESIVTLLKRLGAEWLAYWTIAGGAKFVDRFAVGGPPAGRTSPTQTATSTIVAELTAAAATAGASLVTGGATAGTEVATGGAVAAAEVGAGGAVAGTEVGLGGAVGGGAVAAGGTAAAVAQTTGAATAAAQQTAAAGVLSTQLVGSASTFSSVVIAGANVAAAALASGGAAGGAASATGGAVGGGVAAGTTTGAATGIAWGTVATVGALVAIIGGIGYALGWWGGGEAKKGSGTFGGDDGEPSWTASGDNAVFIARRFREATEIFKEAAHELDLEVTRLGQVTLNKVGTNYNIGGAALSVLGIENTAQAISEAVAVLAIRGAEFGDSVSSWVAAVIHGSEAVTMAALKADVEFARMVESFGRSDLEQEVAAIAGDMAAVFARIVALVGDNIAELSYGLNQVVTEELSRWQSTRRQITGEELSHAEQLQLLVAQAEIWNAEKALRVASLMAQRDALLAEKELEDVKRRLGVAGLSARRLLLQGELDVTRAHVTAQSQVLAAAATALDVQIAAINRLIDALAALPDIDIKKIRLPRPDVGGGAVEDTAAELAAVRVELARLRAAASGVSEEVLVLRDAFAAFDEWVDRARELGVAESELAQARRDHLAVTERDFLAPFEQTVAGAGLTPFGADVANLEAEYGAAYEQAMELARRAAEVNGTTVEEEYRRLADVIGKAYGVELADLVEDHVTGAMDRVREHLDVAQGVGEFERDLRDLQDAFAASRTDLGEAAAAGRDVSQEMRDLAAAERHATRALGVGFVRSLEDLGISLPTELVLELAAAEFELARAEAISSAMALAAAGAFNGLSVSLGDLLLLLTSAEFDPSKILADRGGGGAGGGGRGGADDDRAQDLARLEDQLRSWAREALPDATRQAAAMADTLAQVRSDARAAGLSLERVSAAFATARAAFVDDALEPFERLDLPPLEAELQGILDRFVDLLAAFDVAGATAGEMVRLQEAFSSAMADFLERATQGIRDLVEELRGADARVGGAQRFTSAQAEFRALVAAAQAGDLGALEQLEAAARAFAGEAELFLGGGVGLQEVMDEIIAGLESVSEVELVPADIALLQEQAQRLAELVVVAEAQPTRASNDTGLGGVRWAVDRTKEATDANSLKLDDILEQLKTGKLGVADIDKVLASLVKMSTDTGLLVPRFSDVLKAVNGVLDVEDGLTSGQVWHVLKVLQAGIGVKDDLSPAQLSELQKTVVRMLAIETLSATQRTLLQQILAELGVHSLYLEDLGIYIEWQTPSYALGGRIAHDQVAQLHAGEAVLTARQTRAFDRFIASIERGGASASTPAAARGDRRAPVLTYRRPTAPPPPARRSAPPPPATRTAASSTEAAAGVGGATEVAVTVVVEQEAPPVEVAVHEFDDTRLAELLAELRRVLREGTSTQLAQLREEMRLHVAALAQGGAVASLTEALLEETVALRREAREANRRRVGRAS